VGDVVSKDPAFLFYSSDFLTGTMLLTNEQVGKYIRLMCFQHQHGHLSEQDMLKICFTYDADIFSKFQKDDEGLYFNVRLETEIQRRKDYSESRSKNRKSKKHMSNICESYVEHMENENENINGTNKKKEVKKKVFIPPTLDDVKAYCKSRNSSVDPQRFFEYFTTGNWKDSEGKPVKNWKQKLITWESHGQKNQPKPFVYDDSYKEGTSL